MSDGAILQRIGLFIRSSRLEQNKTQGQVALDANLSRSTVSLLERGEVVGLDSLLRVLRVLDALHVLMEFKVNDGPTPLERVNVKKRRQRARPSADKQSPKANW